MSTFEADDKTASAVIRKFEIIGEAAKGVSDEIRLAYPEVPWKEMAGMRDRLIHFYFWGGVRIGVDDDQTAPSRGQATD